MYRPLHRQQDYPFMERMLRKGESLRTTSTSSLHLSLTPGYPAAMASSAASQRSVNFSGPMMYPGDQFCWYVDGYV